LHSNYLSKQPSLVFAEQSPPFFAFPDRQSGVSPRAKYAHRQFLFRSIQQQNLSHNSIQHLSLLVVQSLRYELADAAAMSTIGVFQIASHPSLDVACLWERIAHNLAARVELSEADTEGWIVCIGVKDGIVRCRGDWRIYE
jgi:hypothetical protein